MNIGSGNGLVPSGNKPLNEQRYDGSDAGQYSVIQLLTTECLDEDHHPGGVD